MSPNRPRLLTIAGSDSGGGAGIQADLKTFAAHGCFGMSVVTAVTAQNTQTVDAIHLIPSEIVGAQIDAVFRDLGVDAIKIGMLGESDLIEIVADRLEEWAGPPIVLDPVMISKSGDALLSNEAVDTLLERLFPLATIVTPNLPELARLTQDSGLPEGDVLLHGKSLLDQVPAILVKGGHALGDRIIDQLIAESAISRFEHSRIDTRSTHGTGCTLSAAIAARLGHDLPLERAVSGAIEYLQAAIRKAPNLGTGHGPVEHFPQGIRSVLSG